MYESVWYMSRNAVLIERRCVIPFAAQIQNLNLGVNIAETVWNMHAHRNLQTAKDGIPCAKVRGSRKWRTGETCVSLVPSLVCSTRCCYPRCQPGSFSWTGRSLWLVHRSEQHPEPPPQQAKSIVPAALCLPKNNKNKPSFTHPAVRRWTRFCAKQHEGTINFIRDQNHIIMPLGIGSSLTGAD